MEKIKTDIREYYVHYKRHGSSYNRRISAHTAREALALFKEGKRAEMTAWTKIEIPRYDEIVGVMEWISNSNQLWHEVKFNEIVST